MKNNFDTKKIPDYALKVAKILLDDGFDCYLVGGAVRDNLLGLELKDVDFTTNATPEQLVKLEAFPKSVQINERFGTIAAIVEDEFGENHTVEITTYRSEEDYVSGRWPSIVKFGVTLEEDLSRRDFTINALAVDMKQIVQTHTPYPLIPMESGQGESLHAESSKADSVHSPSEIIIIDKFNGLEDLENKIIRTVGNPIDRFAEDGLRPVRAIRFASTLGLTIEKETFDAISKSHEITRQISIERFRDELMKLLLKSPKPSVGLHLLKETGIMELFIPELLEGVGVTQPKFHVDNVFEHILKTVDCADDSVKLSALFHDIGKPRANTHDGHFYGHDQIGAEMTREIMTRLKFSTVEIEKTVKLVECHMFYFPDNAQWSDGAVRRFMIKVGLDNLEDLFKLRIADATSNPKTGWDPTEIERLQLRISKVLEEDNALKITDLNITGHDLMALGLSGKDVGIVLKNLLEQVIDEPKLNTKETLIELAKNVKLS